jgi:RHS repeat-associated protein
VAVFRFLLIFTFIVLLPRHAICADGGTGGIESRLYSDEYRLKISAAKEFKPLDDNLFGDSINGYSGAVEFSITDVDLPGNNSLSVSVRRKFAPQETWEKYIRQRSNGMFGEWELDIPHMQGVFARPSGYLAGWQTSGSSPDTRCAESNLANSTPPQQGYYSPEDYWHGNHLYLPGSGSSEIFHLSDSSTNKPTDGLAYHWATKQQWFFSCLPVTSNGVAGDAFLAHAPDGTKYWFNHFAGRAVPPADDGSGRMLPRSEVWIMPTRVEDRFGNSVVYVYDAVDPWRLLSITSSDGRRITLTYVMAGQNNHHVSTVSDGTRTWTYNYSTLTFGGLLTSVTQPDNTKWIYSRAFPDEETIIQNATSCGGPGALRSHIPFVYSFTHPSGAVGKFTWNYRWHGRTNVPQACQFGTYRSSDRRPPFFAAMSLSSKEISGPGMPAAKIWSWSYPALLFKYAHECVSSVCPTSKVIGMTQPDGGILRQTFGIQYGLNDGLLLQTDQIASDGISLLRSSTADYQLDPAGQVYPARVADLLRIYSDPKAGVAQPIRRQQINQQGVTFTNEVANTNGLYSFDNYAKPLTSTFSSSLGYSRTEKVSFYHDLNKWVLGQVATITDVGSGLITRKTEYDSATALPWKAYQFDALRETFAYNPDGTVASVRDGANHAITLSNWYRGIPGNISYPDGNSERATINGLGFITSWTDRNSFTNNYSYDPMGRLASVTPPTGDTVAWASTMQTFAPSPVAAYGLPVGHWKQTISKGNYRKEIYYDAQWHPIVTSEYDSSNVTGTKRFNRMAYDNLGRIVFASYPGATDALTSGVRSEYDGLGRVTKVKQDSELGPLNTSTEYLTGFQTRVTNPRGFATTTSYQVFDKPSTSYPEVIVSPEGMTTTILRNVFGNALSVTRNGNWNNTVISSTRSYVYDSQQRLCKRIEPETGATIMDYDAVDNLAWSVQGSALTGATCDRASVTAADKTVRTYDNMNRLLTTDVPDSTNDLTYDYFSDGVLKMLTNGSNRWDYTYNKLRLPVNEQLTVGSRVKTITHTYNSLGQESSLIYPSGLVVAATPNALGQASQAGAFAMGVSYYPNGGMIGFNYGNGIVHSMTQSPQTQNTRLLPIRSQDMDGTNAILDDTYTYDANGNVVGITDGTAGAGGNRSMSYDNADRLIQTNAPGQWWLSNNISYDALDNIRVNTLGNRTYNYQYNATSQRLDHLTLPNALVARTLVYDALGNVTTNGAQSYVFDKANRMQSVTGKESYEYDGHGRRVKITKFIGKFTSYPMYSLDGKLITEDDSRIDKTIDYIYLNGSLVAKRSASISGPAPYTTSYQHTDSLGSPVAETDAARTVTKIERYTPYGEPSDQSYDQGPGFTGHVTDATSGLTYAQQRYYDPILGRFLSVDAIETSINDGNNFNRYSYANNNPYKFIDPDGRFGEATAVGCALTIEIGCAPGAAVGLLVDGVIAIAGAILIYKMSSDLSDQIAKSSPIYSDIPLGEKLPFRGPPGETLRGENGSRTYGPDGYPDTDRDPGHPDEKGIGRGDHVHDWGRPKDGGAPTDKDRGSSREPKDGDPPLPRGPGTPPPPEAGH